MDNCTIITNSNSIDKNKWSDFVYNHPNGNIFQTPEMYKVYQKTKNYEPIFINIIENKNIVAIMLAVIQKENFGILGALTARSIIWGGPLVKNNNPDILDVILKKYNKIISRKAIYTQFRNLWEWNKDEKEVFIQSGFEYEDHLDIVHDLTTYKGDFLSSLKSKVRTKIKKAQNNGVYVSVLDLNNQELVNDSVLILSDVYKKAKLPLPDTSFFLKASEILIKNKNIAALGAYVNEDLIGVRWFLCFKNVVYDWYAGSKSDYLSYRPNDILPCEEIQWSMNNGYKYFDFGGAGKPGEEYGVRDFKLKFGGKLVNWGRFEKVHKKFLMKIGKLGFKFWQRNKYER